MIIMEDHSMNHKIVQKIKATVPADIGDDTHVKDVIDAFKDLLAAKPDELELIVHDEVVCNQVIVQKK